MGQVPQTIEFPASRVCSLLHAMRLLELYPMYTVRSELHILSGFGNTSKRTGFRLSLYKGIMLHYSWDALIEHG